jgi:UDP-glucose:tetrahydrobiopterin glucosyltransferase
MNQKCLSVLIIASPIAPLGGGHMGGVELTLLNIAKGLTNLKHRVFILAPEKSILPKGLERVSLIPIPGKLERNCLSSGRKHVSSLAEGTVLKNMEHWLQNYYKRFSIILNLAYECSLLSLTHHSTIPCCHLISMGSETDEMDEEIRCLSQKKPTSLAFHSITQAKDFNLSSKPIILGNGFDMRHYQFCDSPENYLGWAGRISPEKGLEDAIYCAESLGYTLKVWGVVDDRDYFNYLQKNNPSSLIHWRGFLRTPSFQKELRQSMVFINTPKYNEAFGNVVIEALACGVPVITYKRGNPGEIIKNDLNGVLVKPNDKYELTNAIIKAKTIDRYGCHLWAKEHYSLKTFSRKVESWLYSNLEGE